MIFVHFIFSQGDGKNREQATVSIVYAIQPYRANFVVSYQIIVVRWSYLSVVLRERETIINTRSKEVDVTMSCEDKNKLLINCKKEYVLTDIDRKTLDKRYWE